MCKNCLRSIKNYRKNFPQEQKKMSRANILITYNLLVNQIKKLLSRYSLMCLDFLEPKIWIKKERRSITSF